MLFNAYLSKGNLYFIYFLKQVGAYVPIIQYSRWTILEYENETRKNLMLLTALSTNKIKKNTTLSGQFKNVISKS